MKHLTPTRGITRRDALKGMSAVVAAAALTGCSTGGSTDDTYVSYAPELTYDKDTKCVFSTGPYDCGGACVHQYRIKNGRVLSMTSAGDIKRVTLNENDPNNPDEWDAEDLNKPMQHRACVRGYAYMDRLYQPDRIRYPLMQTKTRGDITGFKRVTWEEAMEEIGRRMVPVYQKAATVGYIPSIWDPLADTLASAGNMNLPTINFFSNPSQGLIEAGKLDAVGQDMWRNSRNDRFNSGFIISWGADPSRQAGWESGAYWIMLKAKEKGIPIVTITPNCNANASVCSNSVTVQIPNDPALSTSGENVTIPGWIAIRPGTDGALLTAMMYVIYRRKIYDYEFLMNENTGANVGDRKAFGFWAGDSVVSVAEPGTHNGFPKDIVSAGITAWQDFNGETFSVPVGDSFEEYLVSLENEININTPLGWSPINQTGAPSNGGWLKGPRVGNGALVPPSGRDNRIPANQGFDTTLSDPSDYYGVLEYAARVTGVNAKIIEALACHYANNGTGKASLLDIGCGPQRAYNGAEYYWLGMCISVICGHADKKGGGLGLGIFSIPDQLNIVDPGANKETASFLNHRRPLPSSPKRIVVNNQNIAELLTTGRDGRSAQRFMEDTAWTTKGDLPNLTGVEIEALYLWTCNMFTVRPNMNKLIKALRNTNKLKVAVYVGEVFNNTAALCDFVFPDVSDFEQNKGDVGVGLSAYHDSRFLAQNVLKHNMFGIQSGSYTSAMYCYYVSKALKDAGIPNINVSFEKPDTPATAVPEDTVMDDMDAIKAKVEGYQSSATYDRATGQPITGLSYERLLKEGAVSIPIPSSTPVIGLKHHRAPGGDPANNVKAFTTTTGYFNFYSPLWGDSRIRRDRLIQAPPADNFSYGAGWRTPVAKYVPMREGYERYFRDNNPYNEFTGYRTPFSPRVLTLQYITNKAVHRLHTVHGNVASINQTFRPGVFLNSSDAAARGITDGQLVYVYNNRGCMKIPAIVSNYMAPGVVSIEHGAWYQPSTDPNETFKVYYEKDLQDNGTTTQEDIIVPIDLGGSANILTDDMFMLDMIYVRNAPTVHGGACEISATKPE